MSIIKIVPLDGIRGSGKSMYVTEVEDEIFILDCGLQYPEGELLGIDAATPDFTYLGENSERIVGVFLAHGHANVIRALPYLLSKIQVPVFGTELAIELARLSVNSHAKAEEFKDFHMIDPHTEIDFGRATVSSFKTTHTIPNSIDISIRTKEGNIVYIGDFKFDQSAIEMYQTNYDRLTEVGEEGVLALLSDSSNAKNLTQVTSEAQIAGKVFNTIRHWERRVIVACVASNLQRVQQVLNVADRSGRRVILTSQDSERIIRMAMKLEKLQLPSGDLLVRPRGMKKYAPEQLLILEMDRMGEPIKSLQKMANNTHNVIRIGEGGLVYITTTPTTTMETTVAKTEDVIYRTGAAIRQVSNNLRVSGHTNPNDLQLMLNLVKPKYFIPVQSECHQLAAHADLAHEIGVPYKDIFIADRGDILEYTKGRMSVAGSTAAENIMINGVGVGDIGNIVLRGRRILSEDGIFVAVVAINHRKERIVSPAKITSRGLAYVKISKDLMKESSNIVTEIVEKHLKSDDFKWNKLKREIREGLSRYLFEQAKCRPTILPVIMEATQRKRPKNNA